MRVTDQKIKKVVTVLGMVTVLRMVIVRRVMVNFLESVLRMATFPGMVNSLGRANWNLQADKPT